MSAYSHNHWCWWMLHSMDSGLRRNDTVGGLSLEETLPLRGGIAPNPSRMADLPIERLFRSGAWLITASGFPLRRKAPGLAHPLGRGLFVSSRIIPAATRQVLPPWKPAAALTH